MIEMNVNQIYPNLGISKDILGITANSKRVRENYIFVAIKGNKQNGKKYIKEALERGACLIITDQMVLGNYTLQVGLGENQLMLLQLLKTQE